MDAIAADPEANAFERGRQMRASLRAVVLREYRAITAPGAPLRRESEVRGPSTPATERPALETTRTAAPRQAARPDPTDADIAAIALAAQRAQERGLIPAAGYPL